MRRVCLAVLLAAASVAALAADRSAGEHAKIDWLLRQIRESKATFIRNGSEYESGAAATYIAKKLAVKGADVVTARDFIARIATRSETTRKPYEIRPPGAAATPLGPWLTQRLDRYEKERKAPG